MTPQESQNLNPNISLQEASALAGLHQDYLRFLCRAGKLKGFKIGRNWVTTKAFLNEFLVNNKNVENLAAAPSGTSVQVHVHKEPVINVAPAVEQQKIPQEDLEALAGTINLLSTPQIKNELSHLKGEVFENIQNRVHALDANLRDLENKVKGSAIAANLTNETVKPSEVISSPAAKPNENAPGVVAKTSGEENFREGLHSKFASALAIEGAALLAGDTLSTGDKSASQSALGYERIKKLYQSFVRPVPSNIPAIAAAALIALAGLVGSVLFFSNAPKQVALTEINYSGASTSGSGGQNQNNSGPVTINQGDKTQIVNQLLGLNQSQVYSLIDDRLNQYLASGKFKGEPGETGAQGPQGPTGLNGSGGYQGGYAVYPPVPQNNFPGGTSLAVTQFSADSAVINNLQANNINAGSGTFNSLTVNNSSTLNGTTTIANLSITGLNLGFTQGSVVFQGPSGFTQDNNNFFYSASTTQLSLGTSTPNSSAILELDSTSKGFLAPRMTQAQRDAIVSPAQGLFVYNTTSNGYETWNGSAWVSVGASNGNASVATGTVNSFAYYSSQNQLSPQNILFINGNTIGVGTTTGQSEFTLQATGSPTSLFTIASTSGSSLLTVTAGGLVGVGTSNPSANLDGANGVEIEGNGSVSYSLTSFRNAGNGGNITLNHERGTQALPLAVNTGDSAGTIYFQVLDPLTSQLQEVASIQSIYNGNNGSNRDEGALIFALNSSNDEQMRIVTDTNDQTRFGFGTNAPVATFDFQTLAQAASGNTYGMRLQQQLVATSSNVSLNALYINPTFNDNSKSNVSHNGLIVVSGNTGLGTTTPIALLSLQGTAGANDLFDLASSTGASVLRVSSTGNVGIGTTTPTAILNVVGPSVVSGTAPNVFTVLGGAGSLGSSISLTAGAGNSNGSGGGSISLAAGNGASANGTSGGAVNVTAGNGVASPGSVNITAGSGSGIAFANGGSVVINAGIGTNGGAVGKIILANLQGNVGIGTITPTSVLFVQGTTTRDILTIASSSGTSILKVTSGGNVGIGTTTPSQLLSVAGNMQLTGALFDSNNASGTIGSILQSTGTGIQWISTTTLVGGLAFVQNGNSFGATGTLGTIDNFPLNVITNNTTRLTVTNGGNVGIGTITPTSTLFVQGSGSTNLFAVASSSGSTLDQIVSTGQFGIGAAPQAGRTLDVTSIGTDTTGIIGRNAAASGIGVYGFANGTSGNIQGVMAQAQVAGNATAVGLFATSNGVNSGTNYGVKISVTGATVATSNIGILSSTAAGGYPLLTSGGNIGFNTLTPSYNLSLVGIAGSDLFDAASSSGTSYLHITQAGNVGIGTTTPANLLDVKGSADVQNQFAIGTTSVTGFGLTLQYNSSAIDPIKFVDTNTGGRSWVLGGGAGIANTFTLRDVTAGAVNRFTVDANGNTYLSENGATSTAILTVLQAGNVGIGTTTPGTKLTVQASPGYNSTFSDGVDTASLYINNTAGSGVAPIQFGSVTNNNIGFFTNNSAPQMTLTTGGNTGIGTTTPAAKLQISGAQDPLLILNGTSAASSPALQFSDSASHLWEIGTGWTTATSNEFFVWDRAANKARLLIDTNGKVGIGTTSPTFQLQVYNGSGTSYIAADTVAANNAGFRILKDNVTQWIMYNPGSSSDLRFNDGSDRITFQNGGNVGIGTTSPVAKLQVGSNGFSLSNDVGQFVGAKALFLSHPGVYTNQLSVVDSSALAAGVGGAINFMGNYTGTSPTWFASISGIKENATDGDYNGALIFNTRSVSSGGDAAEKMRITSAGNVGIGTITPTSTLYVQGTGSVNPFNITSSTGTSLFSINTAGAELHNGLAGSAGQILQSNGSTAAPTWISTTTLASSLNAFVQGGNSFGATGTLGTFDNNDLNIIANNTPKITILKAGNVGINNSNPQAQLDVTGAARISSILTLSNAGTTAILQFSNASNGNKITFNNGGPTNDMGIAATSTASNSILSFGYTPGPSTAITPVLNVVDNGNVGIGTTTPTAKLEVTSATKYDGVQISGSQAPGLAFITNSASASARNYLITTNSNTLGDFAIWQSTGNNSPIPTGGTAVAKFTMDSNGNVGIGTTTPSDILNVYKSQNANTFITLDNPSVGGTAAAAFKAQNSTSYAQLAMLSTGYTTGGAYAADGALLVTNGAGGLALATRSASPISFYTNGFATPQMIVTSGGNVGIGTTTPSARLSLTGTSAIDPFDISSTSGTSLVHVTQAGNVGVGTTTPNQELVVVGASGSNSDIVIVGGNVGTVWDLGVADSSNNGAFTIGQGSSLSSNPRLTITTGGNVGIGIINPVLPLEVIGSNSNGSFGTYSSSTGQGLAINPNNTAGIVNIYSDFLGGSEPKLHLSTYTNRSSAAGLTIDTTGNVGIGTTGPGAKLDVTGGRIIQAGSAGVTGYLETNSGMLSSQTALNPGVLVFGGDAANAMYGMDLGYNGGFRTRFMTGSASTDFAFGYNSSANPSLQSSFTELVTIKGSGNLGIGTTTPLAKLSIVATSSNPTAILFDIASSSGSSLFQINGSGAELHSGSAGSAGQILQSNGSTAAPTWISTTTLVGGLAFVQNGNSFGATGTLGTLDGNALNFITNNAIRLTIASSTGNVGIGTTAPGDKLNVIGNILLSGGSQIYTANNTGTLKLGGGAGGTSDDIQLTDASANVFLSTNHSGSFPAVTVSGGAIGNTSAVTFQVNGPTSNTSPLQVLKLASAATTINFAEFRNNGNTVLADITALGGAYFAGNVGIGTTTPSARLSLTGTSAIDPFDISSTSGVSLVHVTQAGNVGIGTTSPNTLLTIGGSLATTVSAGLNFGGDVAANLYRSAAGTIRTDGTFSVNGANFLTNVGNGNLTISPAGSGAIYLNYNSGTGGVIFNNGAVGTVGSVTSAGNASFNGTLTVSGAGNNSFIGNVGIGTITPTSTLYVQGTGSTNPFNVTSSTGTSLFSINTAGAELHNGLAGSAGQILQSNGSTAAPTWVSTTTLASSLNAFVQNGNSFGATGTLGTIDGNALNFITNNTIRLTIASSTGFVGIGTTNPAQALHIVGPNGSDTKIRIDNSTNSADIIAVKSNGDFYINTNSTGNVLYLANGGNVGIGTTTPGSNLTVVGSGAFTSNLSVSGDIVITPITPSGATRTIGISSGVTQTTLKVTGGANNAALGNGGPLALTGGTGLGTGGNVTIDAGQGIVANGNILLGTSFGNIGIGTSSPSAKLSITGTSAIDPFDISSTSGVSLVHVNQAGALSFNNSFGSAGQILQSNGNAASPTWISTSTLVGGLAFVQNGNSFGATGTLGTIDANQLNIITNNTTRLSVTSAGNVGIGTTTPSATLMVQGGTTAGAAPNAFTVIGGNGVGNNPGGATLIQGGNGGGGSGAGGLGGALSFVGGNGGAALLSGTSGTGGAINITAGTGGVGQIGGANGNGGNIVINAGVAGGSGAVSGNIILGSVSGNVGIGSSSPSQTLVVQGSGANDIFNITSSTGGSLVYVNSAGNVNIGNAAVSGALYPNITNSILNVGSVPGSNAFNIAAYDTSAFAQGVGGGITFEGRYSGGGSYTYFAGIRGVKTNSTAFDIQGDLAFYTQPNGGGSLTEKMRITSTGNVGIGTSTPGAPLVVSGSTVLGVKVVDSSASHQINVFTRTIEHSVSSEAGPRFVLGSAAASSNHEGLAFSLAGGGTVANSGGGIDVPLLGNLAFYTSNSSALVERMRIDANGNVGIGTSTPSARLSLTGTSAIDPFDISSTSGVSLVHVTQAGNVGIGTTSPTLARLVVNGSSGNGQLVLQNTAASTNIAGFGISAGTNAMIAGDVVGDLSIFSSAGKINFSANNGNTDAMVITNSSNVGIGTTTPLGKLEVYGGVAVFDNANNQIRVVATTGGVSNTNDLGIFNQSNGSTVFSIADYATGLKGIQINTATGNVGIGTTSPVERLAVEGALAFRERTGALPTATTAYGKLFASSTDHSLYYMDGTGTTTNISQPPQLANNFVVDTAQTINRGDVVSFVNGKIQQGFGVSYGNPSLISTTTASAFPISNGQPMSIKMLDSTHFVQIFTDTNNSNKETAIIGVVSGNSITYGASVLISNSTLTTFNVQVLDSTHFVVTYSDNTNLNKPTSVIGVVSGGSTITFGTGVLVSNTTSTIFNSQILDSTHFVVTYVDNTNSNRPTAIVGVVSGGNAIAFGTGVQSSTSNNSSFITQVIDSTHFAIGYLDSTNSLRETVVVAQVTSGNLVGFGTAVVNNSTTGSNYNIQTLDSTHIVMMSQDSNNSLRETGVIGTLTSTSTLTFGTTVPIPNSNTSGTFNTQILDSTHFLFTYTDNNNGSKMSSIVGVVSGGNTITFGTGVAAVNSSANSFVTQVIDSTHFVIAFPDGTNGSRQSSIVGTISGGSTITFGVQSTFDGAFSFSSLSSPQPIVLDSSHFVILYAASGIGIKAIIGSPQTSGFPIGVARAGGSAGSSIAVVTSGVSSDFTGLTAGLEYYALNNGTVTTTLTSNVVGLAISATQILLKSEDILTGDSPQFFGDAIFANNFKITEMQGGEQGLIFKNQLNRDILSVTEAGDLSIVGVLQSKKVLAQQIIVGYDSVDGASSTDASLLVNQNNSGSLLVLQNMQQNRFMVASSGSVSILAQTATSTDVVLNVSNGSSTLFTINSVGNAQFTGHIIVGKDTAGTAIIKAGDNQTTVTFTTPYNSAPKVLVTPQDVPVSFAVTQVTPTGFSIIISPAATQDINLNWFVVEQPDDTLSQSSGNAIGATPPAVTQSPLPTPTPAPDVGEVLGTSTPPDISPTPQDTPTPTPTADTSTTTP